MEIKNKTCLVLGGWGLVGRAIIRQMIPYNPKRIIVTSLKKQEAQEEVSNLKKEYPNLPKDFFVPWWGNILVRDEYKDLDRNEIIADPEKRRTLISDNLDDLTPDILKKSALYKLIAKFKPEVIVDCINTATGIAYQDVYTTYKEYKTKVAKESTKDEILELSEKLLTSMYIPQLIRHMQILYNAMHEAKTEIFVKIGTSGTGGMGLNIPYTHSEEKPSRVLLSKSAVAGAHTLLLFLMARTPDTAITKEIKPAAAIAWKKIAFDTVKKRGKAIELLSIDSEDTIDVSKKFAFKPEKEFKASGEVLKSVFIDTGENGIFSRGEFEAITADQQMEFITPEEIAQDAIFEIRGGNTGHDIINALDNAIEHPSYRAGYMQNLAVEKLDELEKEYETHSVAFEMLGPPRLSKLLFEIHLLKITCGTMKAINTKTAKKHMEECVETIKNNHKLRNEMLSIGIPILMPDGKTLLRGNEVKIPVFSGEEEIPMTPKKIDEFANAGWVDLREKNMKIWNSRIKALMDEAKLISDQNTSSQFVRTKQYWNYFERIDIGRVVSWIFINEEKGGRMKG